MDGKNSTIGTPIYGFDDFRLNPLARELSRNGENVPLAASAFDCLVYLIEHRERPVGRDELISAVWGRADVSDNLLAQTIVRLRRALDDSGDEHRCIKTIPRVGYRWMLDITVMSREAVTSHSGQAITQDDAGPVGADDDHSILHAPASRTRRWVLLPMVALFVCADSAGYWYWQARHRVSVAATMHFDQGAAIVLPTEVEGPEDWKWLRLGLMDLIATQLRDARVPTESSQDVLHLLNNTDTPSAAMLSTFAMVVRSHVALADNVWHVSLEANGKNGRSWHVEASSENVLNAAHTANNQLLVQLGYAAAPSSGSGNTQQEYLLRILAAQLASQPKLAQQLIDNAPADLRATADLTFAQAQLYCDEGKMDPCEQPLLAVVKQASVAQQPVLHAKALTGLWYFYNRKHQFNEGMSALDEAVKILQGQKDSEALATAYLDRSHLSFFHDELEPATQDLGRARINYTLAGDTTGQAKVDFALGMIANRRGQFAQAVPLLQSAYEQYQRMGVKVLLIAPLSDLALAHQMLLQFPEELAATDRFWPLDPDFLDDYVRHQLTITRANALADNGRTLDASTLLQQLQTTMNAGQEADLIVQSDILLAKWALQRGDTEAALSWMAKAMSGPGLSQDNDARDNAEAWLVQVLALQRTGNTQQLASTVNAMQAWASRVQDKDDWVSLRLMQAKAAQAWSEGHRDQALEHFRQAMSVANKLGVPELIVDVGQSWASALLDAGQVDQAQALSGQLSTWATADWRAAWVQAQVYQALNQGDAAQRAQGVAKKLAGDRALPQ